MSNVTLHRVRFLEEEVFEGSIPHDDAHTTTQVVECDDWRDAVRALTDEGLTFAATGNDWAADPDGSRIISYATGMREEVSGHLNGFDLVEVAVIVDAVDHGGVYEHECPACGDGMHPSSLSRGEPGVHWCCNTCDERLLVLSDCGDDDEPEKPYLVCTECGEAFDSLTTASEHDNHENTFEILPESEAL